MTARLIASLRQTIRLSGEALLLCGRAAPRDAWLTVGTQLANAGALVVQLLLIKVLAGEVAAPQPVRDLSASIALVGMLVLVSALTLGASVVQEELQPLLAMRISTYALERVLRVSSAVPLLLLETSDFQDRLARAHEGGEIRSFELAQGALVICTGLATSAGAVIAVFLLAPVLGVVLLLAALPLWIATSANMRLFRSFVMDYTADRRQRAYVTRVLTVKDSAHEIRAYDASGFFLSRFASVSERLVKESAQLARARAARSAIGSLVSTGLTGLSLLTVLYMVHARYLTGPVGITIIAAIVLASRGVANVAFGLTQVRQCSVFLEDYHYLLKLQAQRPAERCAPSEIVGNQAFRVETKDLSFRYPASAKPTLSGVSISLEQGQITALIGRNGSGKTTLAKILCGLYSPTAGDVTWDGASIDRDVLHERSTIAFQDFARYMMTVRENIAIAGTDDAAAAVTSAVESRAMPTLNDVIDQLPAGLDTLLGTYFAGGTDLSSGQWQRLAIARALIRGGQLIVLDEPGAFLDAIAERDILAYAKQLSRQSAVLLISQNLENLDLVDKAYLMDRGRVTDVLSPDDLSRSSELYSRFAEP